jgi:zinc protease
VADAARKWLSVPHYTLTVVPFPKLLPPKDTLDRSVLPALGENPVVKFPEVQRAALKNGLEVVLLERHSAPLVNMTLVVDAGYSSDAKGREGISSFALGLMDDGTTSRDAYQVADELDVLGASVSTGNDTDVSLVRLRALRMNLEGSVGVFADVVLNPVFPEGMVAIVQKQTVAAIRQEKATPRAASNRLIPGLLYGEDHAYGKPATGSGYESVIERLQRADLVAWHREWFVPGNATLVVAGDVTMKELVPRLEKAFGAWKTGTVPRKEIGNAISKSAGKVFLLDKPGAPQSMIVAAHLSQPGGQPDDLAMEMVMRNFGGMATSRLNRNLRLDKHWSYGTAGMLVSARGQRPFLVLAPVQSDKTKEAMVEVMKEIRGVAGDRPVAGEEYASIMRNMVMRLPGRFETLASLESAAIDLVNFGYPPEHFYDYAKNVGALTEKDLAVAAAKFVKPGELTWMVIGDLATIEAGVRSLGYGEVVKIDADGNVLK